MDESQKHNAKKKKASCIECIQYNFFYIMAQNGKWNILFKNTYTYGKTIKKKKRIINTSEDNFGKERGMQR